MEDHFELEKADHDPIAMPTIPASEVFWQRDAPKLHKIPCHELIRVFEIAAIAVCKNRLTIIEN